LTVKSGDRVFIGTACATPRTLIRALEASKAPVYEDRPVCGADHS
jgi:hypothetical protein